MTDAPDRPETTTDIPTTVIPGSIAEGHHRERPTLPATLAAARAEVADEEYVPVADCVDWLLDCRNAAEAPMVRDVVSSLLPDFVHGNIRTADDFLDALDQIESALRVDEAFEDSSVVGRTG